MLMNVLNKLYTILRNLCATLVPKQKIPWWYCILWFDFANPQNFSTLDTKTVRITSHQVNSTDGVFW